MSAKMAVDTPYNTNITDESSNEDGGQVLGLLLLYGLGALIVIVLGML